MESKKNEECQLVAHYSLDLEAALLTFCPREYTYFAQLMGVDPSKPTKFIPSGPLRIEDWKEVLEEHGLLERYAPHFGDGSVNGRDHIEPLGFRMVDCGRGTYDQHGREENRFRNRLTSWDLLRQDAGETVMWEMFPWLIPLAEIISENDRSAERVALDPGRAGSESPNTERTLRNLIQGLNMAYPDDPEHVEATMHLFYRHMVEGAKRLIDATCGREGAHLSAEGVQEAIEKGADFQSLFHLDYYLDHIEGEVKEIPGSDVVPFKGMPLGDLCEYVDAASRAMFDWYELYAPDPDRGKIPATHVVAKAKAARAALAELHAELGIEGPDWKLDRLMRFCEDVGSRMTMLYAIDIAMKAMEEDWAVADADYRSRGTLAFRTMLVKREHGEKVVTSRQVTVVVAKSDAQRFGARARLGNVGKRQRRNGGSVRAPADIVIQVWSDGRASISTRGIRIEHVARVLRELDLRQKGVKVTRAIRRLLGHPGNLRFRNEAGEWVTTLYLPEYREGTGNAFRTNPYADSISLTFDQIKDYTILALAGYTFEEIEAMRKEQAKKQKPKNGRRRDAGNGPRTAPKPKSPFVFEG